MNHKIEALTSHFFSTGEFMNHKQRMNEFGYLAELGEMVNEKQVVAGALSKENERRGSTCSNARNLSILITSSTHNTLAGTNMVNSAIKAANRDR